MNVEELKHELKKIFGEQVVFNKEFDDLAKVIKNIDTNLISWCLELKDNKIVPAKPPLLPGHFVFVKKIGSSNRCIIIKITNGVFTEIHLGDHKYYDLLRQKLGLKENSRMY